MNIPFRLNLEQQKKRAKELLKDVHHQSAPALVRFQQNHPKLIFSELQPHELNPTLADAQLVIARELSCKNWAQLKNHIALMASVKDSIQSNPQVPDEPDNCLHIRCGSDIQRTLPEAGFNGDFLEFSDPLCTGPVSYDYQPETRARYLFESSGQTLHRSDTEILAELKKSYQSLLSSQDNYEHMVLWFEHDTYDQFILIFILSQLLRKGSPKHLWMVTTNQFPGSVKFRGLGQLPPEALRVLWQTRQSVSDKQLAEADQYWRAFTDSNPQIFHRLVSEMKQSSLPYFKNAADRQLLEMPLADTQLPLTQQITIEILSEGPLAAGKLFAILMNEKEPLPFLGDLMYWHILRQMEAQALIRISRISDHWPEALVSL